MNLVASAKNQLLEKRSYMAITENEAEQIIQDIFQVLKSAKPPESNLTFSDFQSLITLCNRDDCK